MKNQFELKCPIHGAQLKRADCRRCNALYMSAYMRQRRRRDPVAALLERARERAARLGLPFNLRRRDVVVPPFAPCSACRWRQVPNGRADRLRWTVSGPPKAMCAGMFA